MHTATKVAVLALTLVAAGATTAQAQNNATMNVTANVFRPITVAADRNLVFGNVSLSQGANTLPLTLNATYNTVDNAAGTSIASFLAPTATTLSGGASGQLFVYVAGTVTPAANQVVGNYSGTIQLTVIYQ